VKQEWKHRYRSHKSSFSALSCFRHYFLMIFYLPEIEQNMVKIF
jgi:hypothetical protein